MPRMNGIDVEDYPEDLGCSVATKYLRHKYNSLTIQSKCTECPFKKCIDDLSFAQKIELSRYGKGEIKELSPGIKSMACIAQYALWPRTNVRA